MRDGVEGGGAVVDVAVVGRSCGCGFVIVARVTRRLLLHRSCPARADHEVCDRCEWDGAVSVGAVV